MKFGFIATRRGIWPVDVQCGALRVVLCLVSARAQSAGGDGCGDRADAAHGICASTPKFPEPVALVVDVDHGVIRE